MGLQVQQTRIYGIPVPADRISAGELPIDSTIASLGDFSTSASVVATTFTFDFGGISLTKVEEIKLIADTNAEAMLLGNVDLTAGTGLTGGQAYRGYTMYPSSYEEKGGIRIGTSDESLKSFPVTFVTNFYRAKLG
jgi:hypothetical protein